MVKYCDSLLKINFSVIIKLNDSIETLDGIVAEVVELAVNNYYLLSIHRLGFDVRAHCLL